MKHVHLLIAILFFSCAPGKRTAEPSKLADVITLPIEVTPVLVTCQDMYPGTYFNLKKTRTYRAVLEVNAAKAADATAFLIDSVRLPISRMLIDGEEQRMPFPEVPTGTHRIELEATRNFYQDHAPEMVDEVTPKLSGDLTPAGRMELEFLIGSTSTFFLIDLGVLKVLEPVRGR